MQAVHDDYREIYAPAVRRSRILSRDGDRFTVSLQLFIQGTYVQCETVSLSRDIPTGVGWLVGPLVTSIPRESLRVHAAGDAQSVDTQPLRPQASSSKAALVVVGSMTNDASATPIATVTSSIATAWWWVAVPNATASSNVVHPAPHTIGSRRKRQSPLSGEARPDETGT